MPHSQSTASSSRAATAAARRRRWPPPRPRGRNRLLPTTATTTLAAVAFAVALSSSPASASRVGSEYHAPPLGGVSLRGGGGGDGSHLRIRRTAAVGGDGDDDERKKRIRGENDERKDANEKLNGREGEERKKKRKKKRTKANKNKQKDEDDEPDDGEATMDDGQNDFDDDDDDDGESSSGKADKPKPNSQAIGGKTDKPGHDGIGESETDDADEPKPNNGVLTSTMDEPKPMSGSSHSLGAPYEDKATLLFALEYLGIDPERFPNMSDEEREEVLMMLDGDLNFDIGGGGGLTLVDGGGGGGLSLLDGELIVGDPTGDVIIYDPEPFASDGAATSSDKWNFSGSCKDDDTVQLESFEDGDNVIPSMHGVSAMTWTTLSVDPWSQSTTRAHDGRWSTRSGITPSARRGATASSSPVYSNLTLTTEAMFKGGVLTFKLHAGSLGLPREALLVTVDDGVELTVGEGTTSSAGNGGWAEYSVAVGYGVHDVRWSHVYNPFGLDTTPPGSEDEGFLWMDDVRYAPFTESANRDQMDMINGNCNGRSTSSSSSALWKVKEGGAIVSASSSDIARNNADIRFTLYSENGGLLTYGLHTSTTAPNDDFAVLINDGGNDDDIADVIFGDMLGFESKSLHVPKGKVTITLRHRKDPGRLGEALLGSLGEISTEGKTRLKDLRFESNG